MKSTQKCSTNQHISAETVIIITSLYYSILGYFISKILISLFLRFYLWPTYYMIQGRVHAYLYIYIHVILPSTMTCLSLWKRCVSECLYSGLSSVPQHVLKNGKPAACPSPDRRRYTTASCVGVCLYTRMCQWCAISSPASSEDTLWWSYFLPY